MKTKKQPHVNCGGAPKGNKNALKHGRYTKDQLESQKFYKSFMKQIHATLKEVEQERFPTEVLIESKPIRYSCL